MKKDKSPEEVSKHKRSVLAGTTKGIEKIRSGKWDNDLVTAADAALSVVSCGYCQGNQVFVCKIDLENESYCALACFCADCRFVGLLDTAEVENERDLGFIRTTEVN